MNTVKISGELQAISRDSHHSDFEESSQDKLSGQLMAHEIGDLYIDHFNESPVEQWAKVMRALRVHGFEINFAD